MSRYNRCKFCIQLPPTLDKPKNRLQLLIVLLSKHLHRFQSVSVLETPAIGILLQRQSTRTKIAQNPTSQQCDRSYSIGSYNQKVDERIRSNNSIAGGLMKRLSVFLTAAGLTLAGVAQGEVVNLNIFNTGVDATTGISQPQGSTDSHYTVVSSPAGVVPVVQTSVEGFPIPPWIGDSTTSAWIGPAGTAPAGDYTYQTTFDLTGLDPATAILSGQWATDNAGVLVLNGVSTGFTSPFGVAEGSYSFEVWHQFTINSGFVDGVNTLDFVVNNADVAGLNPTGLRVEISGTADVATPEPGTFGMFGLGSTAVFAILRRGRKVTA
jgi:PEP-CTERM motif